MMQADVRTLEDASRSALGWSSDDSELSTHPASILSALVPASLLLVLAAVLMLIVL